MLKNKKILIISPQRWGKMHLIKHHYALELAKRGNEVYFLNPPAAGLNERINVIDNEQERNLHVVNYKPIFPFVIRFHLRWLYDLLMGIQIDFILKSIGKRFDIVWCFELLLYSDLKKFKGKLTVFHIGDMLYYDYQVNIAKRADIIFSVAEDILKKLNGVDGPKYFINHGLSYHFEHCAEQRLIEMRENNGERPAGPVRIGYSGNMLRKDIDEDCLKSIIRNNKDVQFYFWGPTAISEDNFSGDKFLLKSQIDFINFLKNQDNIKLCGVKDQDSLASEMQEMDGFLICYDIDRDHSKGTNYHKIIEYLSTGRVIISNNVTTYANKKDLVQMPEERHNENLEKLFLDVIGNLSEHNSYELQKKRIEFALENTYKNQLDKLDSILSDYSGGQGPE